MNWSNEGIIASLSFPGGTLPEDALHEMLDHYDDINWLVILVTSAKRRLAAMLRMCGRWFTGKIPLYLQLPPLSTLNPHALCQSLLSATDELLPHDMLTRFLCGISNPLFTRIKARGLPYSGLISGKLYP